MPDILDEVPEPQSAPVVENAAPQGVNEARKQHVAKLIKDVKAAKKHWARDFQRMRSDIYFAEGNHWPDALPGLEEDRIVVDVTARHLQLRTSALYAKNPTVVARRKDSLDFVIWDENLETLMLAQQRLMQAFQTGVADDSIADDLLLLRDVAAGMARREALDKFAKTLEIVFRDQIDHAQNPPFKGQVKNGIPRVLTTGVFYAKLDYERAVGRRPGTENRLDEARDRLARLNRMLGEAQTDQDGEYGPETAKADELRTQIAALEAEPVNVLKEGLVFSFPDSTSIIPDKKCKNLVGFIGSDWVAEEQCLTPEEIKESWRVDVSKSYKRYSVWYDGQINEARTNVEGSECLACVYTIFNRRTGLVYVVCDGYDDFLVDPAPPENKTQYFWPWYALVFNRLESQRSPFPKSDVRLMKPLQLEINRTMEALRQHRIANQPKYLGDATAFEDDEKINLTEYPPHEVIFVKALAEGKSAKDMVVELPKAAIDPNVYSTDVLYEALMRVIGSQEANLGAPQGGDTTATESSIAEASRLSSQQSNADDLDDWLSLLARNAGELLVREMNFQTVREIAGPGAVWTQLSREELASAMFLEVQAGSTGRPNQAQDLANLERALPFLVQMPGIDPQKLAEWVIRVTDGRMKPADLMNAAIKESIVSMNRGAPALLGGPTDPAAQGDRGAQNAPNDDESRGGPVPGEGFKPRVVA